MDSPISVKTFLSEYISYQQEKRESARWDQYFGFEIDRVERSIQISLDPEKNAWIGLAPESLQTPYSELEQIFVGLRLPEEALVVDIGAGYGRMGIVASMVKLQFLGFELVAERVAEAQRVYRALNLDPDSMILADVTKILLPTADCYFLYDFGTKRDIRIVLEMLATISLRKKIIVVGRGRSVRDVIEQETPWLSQINRPIHHKNYSFYFS